MSMKFTGCFFKKVVSHFTITIVYKKKEAEKPNYTCKISWEKLEKRSEMDFFQLYTLKCNE